MRVLVCGDRNWKESDPIRVFLCSLPKDSVVIHGAARGADSVAGKIAEAIGLRVETYPANWNKFGKAAGHIRNKEMLDTGKPDMVVYFHRNLKESKGTRNMVQQSVAAGLPVFNGRHPWADFWAGAKPRRFGAGS